MTTLEERIILNSTQPKIRVLPPETLSYIFQEVVSTTTVPEVDVNDSQTENRPPLHPILTLISVCSLWREVALKTPRLWMDICINFSTSDILPKSRLLELYLRNSGTFLPLELCLHFNPDVSFSNHGNGLLHPTVDDLIHRVLGRVTWLRIFYPVNPSAWLSLTPQLSQLKGLAFEVRNHAQTNPLELSNNLSLSHLSLASFISKVSLPWDSVTCLYLESVPISTCLHLLFHSPNLEIYEMTDPLPAGNIPLPVLGTDTLTLSQLKSLKWEYWDNLWDASMLRRVQVPALKSLVWQEHDFIQVLEIKQDVISFFRRLPTSLDYIAIQTPIGHRGHVEFLSPDSRVRHMRLGFYENPSLCDTIIRHFQCMVANDRITAPFPKLESLTIEIFREGRWGVIETDSTYTFETLANRGGVLDTVMVLELFGCTLTWHQGYIPADHTDKIVVREHGEVPDWCQIVAPGMQALSDSLPRTEDWP